MSGPAQAVNLLRCLRRWKSFTGIQSCEMTRHGHGWRVQDPAAGSSLDSPSQQHVIPSLMSAVCCQGYSYHGDAAAWCNTPSQKLLWGERAWGRLRRGGGHHLHCTVPSLTPEVLEAGLSWACRYHPSSNNSLSDLDCSCRLFQAQRESNLPGPKAFKATEEVKRLYLWILNQLILAFISLTRV